MRTELKNINKIIKYFLKLSLIFVAAIEHQTPITATIKNNSH